MALGNEVALKNDPEDESKDLSEASSSEIKESESSTNHESTEPVTDITDANIDAKETEEVNQSDEPKVSEDNQVEGDVTGDVKDVEDKPVETEDKSAETEMVKTEDKPLETVELKTEEKSVETEGKPEGPEVVESEDKQGETEVVEDQESAEGEEAEEDESVPAEEEEEEEDEEELQDPMDDIREQCKTGSEAVKMAQILEECNERVNSRSNTDETCHQEVIDYMHAVDHCMAKSVFSKLK